MILVAKIMAEMESQTCQNYTENSFKENLINCIQGWPCLYDKSRKDYKDNVKRNNAWGAIAFNCCSDVGTCKKTWESLRCGYRQSLKTAKSKSGSGTKPGQKEWKYKNIMSFLTPYVVVESGSTSNVQLEGPLEGEASGDSDHDEVIQEAAVTPAPSNSSNNSNKATPSTSDKSNASASCAPPPAKRRRNEIDESLMAAISTAQKTQTAIMNQISTDGDGDDADTKFGESVAMTLRTFTPYKKALAKARIQSLLLEIEFGEQQLNNSQAVGNAYGTLYHL